MREIGRMLREQRIMRGLDINDVMRVTRVTGYYIKAMEEGKFHIIPKVYDRGYLKIYAGALGMDIKALLELYEKKQRERYLKQTAGVAHPDVNL